MAVGNKYRLKIKRGAGAPSFTLDAGQLYLDTTNKILYVGDGTTNHIVHKAGLKTYRAKVSQSGAGAPSEGTQLENTLGGNPAYARSGVGVYTLILAGAFAIAKTVCLFAGRGAAARVFHYANTDVNTLTISVFDAATPSVADSGDFDILIEVYP